MKAFGIIMGALTALWGVVAFTMPIGTFLGMGWILGLLLLLTGVLLMLIGIKSDPKAFKKVLVGVLVAVVGTIIFIGAASKFLSNLMAIYTVSACLIVFGAIAIYVGCKVFEKDKTKGIAVVACGIIAVLLGGILLIKPTIAMAFIGYIISLSLIVYGIVIIILSMKLGKKKPEEDEKDIEDKMEEEIKEKLAD